MKSLIHALQQAKVYGSLSKRVKLTLLLLTASLTFGKAQTVIVTVTPPDTVGACLNNLYTIGFSGVTAGTEITITPSFDGITTNGCNNVQTQDAYFDFVSALPSNAISNITGGSTLHFTVNNNSNITLSYYAYIGCHISGSQNVNFYQTFTGNNGISFNTGNGTDTFKTSGITKPELVLQEDSIATFYIANKTQTFLKFVYKNNVDKGSLRFRFLTDSTYCNGITTDSIFFQKGANDILRKYTDSPSDTLTLAKNDTLIILQRITSSACLSSLGCGNATASLIWSCNYPQPAAAVLCNDCKPKKTCQFTLFNNDLLQADVVRLSPAGAVREFSCFNDTANATLWSYYIINKGRGVMDSLNFDLMQDAAKNNYGDPTFLMLINKNSLTISKSANSICTIDTSIALRSNWLCQNLVDTALQHCYVRIKNFGEKDTVFISFKTLRCSEENNAALLNQYIKYNQWAFENFYAKDICGGKTYLTGSGLISGKYISGQQAGGAGYDFYLKNNFFPTVSNLSVTNAGAGDSATFSIDFKGIVKQGATNVYQLLGCDHPQNLCDTLHGWLRATVLCDTNLRITRPWQDVYFIKMNSNGDTAFYTPKYYYTSDTIGYSVCRRTSYYFYFNLADSAMRSVLDSGKFVFKLQACCGSDMSRTPYSATFHLLPNPGNCFALNYTGTPFTSHLTPPGVTNYKGNIQWLPLNDRGKSIAVMCPGCETPGVIAQRYYMQRENFGLADSVDDGRADNPPVQITIGNLLFPKINKNFISYGDRAVDFMRANFVDGDPTSSGYNYAQLQAQGLRFNVLQLSRFIPMGLDTMMLYPDSIYFYIDDATPSVNGCLDCEPYAMGANDYTTIRKYAIGGNLLSQFLIDTTTSANEYRFVFTTYHNTTTNTYSGNLHDYPQLITHSVGAFTGFMPGQHYRIKVIYNVCGNFMPVNTSSFVIDDVVKESNVFNRMFFSGKIQNKVSDEIPQQPNTTAALDTLGWTVNPNDTSNVLVDTTFMNTYAFFCEATGSIHYFVSQMAVNNTKIINNQGCEKEMIVEARSSIAGGKGVIDVYPYEYKPPVLLPSDFNLMIPQGYHVKNAVVKNGLRVNGVYVESDTVGLPFLENASGNVTFSAAALPAMNCIFRNNNAGNSTTFYIGDQENWRFITLKLLPDSCMVLPVVPSASTTAQITFHPQGSACLPGSGCTTLSDLVMNPPGNNLNTLSIKPHLQLTGVGNSNAPLRSDTLCWNNLTVQNTNTGNSDQTAADNVFIAIVGSTPHLSNWHFVTGGQTYAAAGNIIPVTPSLAKGASISGNLCATPVSCPIDSTKEFFNIHIGWNCGNYPATPYDSTTICSYILTQLSYNKDTAAFDITQKYYETPYTLCDTVSVWAPFNSKYLGYLYPDSVVLTNLKPNLQVVGAYMFYGNNHLTSASAHLTPTATNTVWITDADSIKKIGYAKGGYNNGRIMTIRFDLLPTCTFAGDTTLPDIVIFAHDFCNEMMSANAHKAMNSTFRMSSVQSACTDCWQITKTADRDTAAAVSDIVTYTITVCNNSANTQTGVLADVLPSGFVQTSSTLPGSVTLNSMQCDTFTVSGYFGSAATGCLFNTVNVTSPANTTWKDSVCVVVIDPCTTTDTTFADSTYSGNATLSNLSVFVAGTYYVNGTLTLNNCMVYVNSGGQIVVQSNGVLNLNNTTIQSCDTMWRGINVLSKGKIYLTNNSELNDANIGIEAHDGSSVNIDNGSQILNCVTGLYIPPKSSGLNNVIVSISNTTFTMTSAVFKPDYIGQSLHGKLPKVGIEIYSVAGFILGGNISSINTFNKLNTGMVAHNSTVTIKNTKFTNIVTDSVYTEAYRGTAMVSVYHENIPAISNPKLTVLPENGTFKTVNNCWRGIYTDGSVLAASFINLLNVNQGVYGTRTPWLQTSMVNNCKITTQATGIFWTNNAYAKNMMAINDSIVVNAPPLTGNNKAKGFSRGAIYMSEISNLKNVLYSATNNTIMLNNSFYGIVQNHTKNGAVKFNTIKINATSPISTTGIALNGTQRVNASCNSITGSYPATGLTYNTSAITASLAERSYIGCNTTDSTVTGIYFGGFNPATRLRGNNMNYHFDGLYLNKVAVIDSQPHGGNLWFGPFNNYGALNLAPTLLVYKSIFLIDPTAPSANFPINYSPAGWFQLTSGTTFDCGKTTLCSTPPTNNYTSDELKELIASGAFQTDEYMDESRAIAEEYLYRELREDSALWVNDSLYAAFIATNEDSVIGKLYEAEFNMDAAMQYDSVFNASMASIDSQTVAFENYISYMDSLAESGTPVINYETERQQTINTLAFLAQTKQNIIIQQEAMRDNKLQDAKLINDIIVPDELPQQNAQIINEIEIAFAEGNGNLDVIRNNYQNILNIAQQCPFAGGQSVFKARVLINLINDSVLYFDDDICLQSDIYRTGKMDSLQGSDIISSVKLMPNPANNKVTVLISGVKEGVCKINIENILSQPVLSAMLDCKKQQHTLDISKLSVGVYSVKIELNNNKYSTVKLVITR